MAFAFVGFGATHAHAQDVTNDGRAEVTFAHPTILDKLSGAPSVWFDGQTGSVKQLRVTLPNMIYHVTPWLQGWGGLIVDWKDDDPSNNTRELRPYVGVKIFVPNSVHLYLYDWTRVEWRRTTNTDNDTVNRVWRFRTRLGVELPLSARAWQPGTFYGLSNGELLVEHDFVDGVRFMSGVGYIRNDRARLEFSYVLELSRSSSSDVLAYTDNSFRFDVKLSFKEGLLHKQQGPE